MRGKEKEQPIDVLKIQPVLDHYKGTEGSLIAILQQTQEIYGYLPAGVMEHIARETGVKPAKIMGVATFYTQFRLSPAGKHIILLCQGTACHVNGAKAIEEAIEAELGITDGQTTPDGLFTLNNVACLGCCSLSPVMMVGGETYGSLTPEKTKAILQSIKKAEGAAV
ncbi:MAG: NADH-quinone oxidoreductase subunit NuoE [Clostridiales bacterium]|jgi:NADH-quinone oxidoreductase subunit E|nr:NADH-quinone oxidoreductase subunit NuoE [Clostridiales bacterium]